MNINLIKVQVFKMSLVESNKKVLTSKAHTLLSLPLEDSNKHASNKGIELIVTKGRNSCISKNIDPSRSLECKFVVEQADIQLKVRKMYKEYKVYNEYKKQRL